MSKNIISIKGTKYGLIFYFNTEMADFKAIIAALEKKLLEAKGFFQSGKYIIDPENQFAAAELDALNQVFDQYGLEAGDLPEAEIAKLKRPAKTNAKTAANTEDEILYPATAPKGVEPLRYYSKEGNSVFCQKTIRSGQTIYAEGNLVIMGDINAGAHIVATGSVVCLGKVRGIIHAGAKGDTAAFIMGYRLQPTQLRIANCLGAANSDAKVEYSEIARLEGGKIVLKPYETPHYKFKKKAIG